MATERPRLIPERVRARREALGLSQQQLADLAGVSQSMIGRIELGAKNRPLADNERAIVAALKSTLAELTGQGVPSELTLDRSAADPEPSASRAVVLVRAIWEASRRLLGIEPEDYEAARLAALESAQWLSPDDDVPAFAESLLRAAASLRREGKVATTGAILTRVAAGRVPGAEARNVEGHRSVDDEIARRTEEAGLKVGGAKHVADEIREKIKKTKR